MTDNVRVEVDRVWWYYRTQLPLPEDLPSAAGFKAWTFGIGGHIKYFPGKYREALAAAKKEAKRMGVPTIYLRA